LQTGTKNFERKKIGDVKFFPRLLRSQGFQATHPTLYCWDSWIGGLLRFLSKRLHTGCCEMLPRFYPWLSLSYWLRL